MNITGYTYKPDDLVNNTNGCGFFKDSNKFVWFDGSAEYITPELDAITAAVEAGAVSQDNWLEQLFGTAENFVRFCNALAAWEFCYAVSDRHRLALKNLVGLVDDEGFITAAEIADRLRERSGVIA